MKKILINFLRDQAGYVAAYLLCTLLIITFYSVSSGGIAEIVYPVIISAFVLLVFLIIRWFPYYRFNSRLPNALKNMNYELMPYTREQTVVSELIQSVHQIHAEDTGHYRQAVTSKNRFISQWVHNMKTPVTVIDLITQKEHIEPADLNGIREENERLRNYLEQVLVLLRLEEFAKDYTPQATDLAADVREIINRRKNHFIYSRVYPKFVSAEPVTVLTDSKWNQIMLEQLVSNAVKYSACDEPKNVYFEISREGEYITLTIRDEGRGIPEYDLKRVFEPFFTGENGRSIKNSSGIGLYLCSEIASNLGHRLNITSTPEMGTAVSISYLSKL